MLSSSLDAFLKLSKTSSPPNLFDYDCVTLYIVCIVRRVVCCVGNPFHIYGAFKGVRIMSMKLFTNHDESNYVDNSVTV